MKKRKALVQKRRLTEAVRLKLIPALKGFISFKCLPKRLFFCSSFSIAFKKIESGGNFRSSLKSSQLFMEVFNRLYCRIYYIIIIENKEEFLIYWIMIYNT